MYSFSSLNELKRRLLTSTSTCGSGVSARKVWLPASTNTSTYDALAPTPDAADSEKN